MRADVLRGSRKLGRPTQLWIAVKPEHPRIDKRFGEVAYVATFDISGMPRPRRLKVGDRIKFDVQTGFTLVQQPLGWWCAWVWAGKTPRLI